MLQYVAALALLAHGIGHLVEVLPAYASIETGFSDKPWIFPGGYTINSAVGLVWGAIWLLAMCLFIVSSALVFMGEPGWRQWAIYGSLVSIVAIVPWWNTVIVGAKPGVAILLVLLLPWGQKVTEFFELP